MKIVVNYLNVVFHIELKTKFNDKFGISFFSLSKTRNSTLGTRIIIHTSAYFILMRKF